MTETKTAPREYVVLQRITDGRLSFVGIQTATSARRAVDELRDGQGGRWVAVPTRNWNEEDVEVVQRETTVRKKMHPGQAEIEMPTLVEA